MKGERFDFDTVISRRGSGSMKWDVQGRDGKLSFGMADMDFPVAPQITEALKRRTEHPIFGYAAATPALRETIAEWFAKRHGWRPEPEWMQLGSGVVTGLALALEALTCKGDRIILLTPVYDQFFTILKGLEREAVCCELLPTPDGGYAADFPAIEKAMVQGAKAVLFCNPQNPVGKVWEREELERLVALCRKQGIWLLSDEIHCDLLMPGYHYTPMLSIEGAACCTVSFLAPNKTFNISGLGLAVAVAQDETLRNRLREQFFGHFIMGSNLFAYAAAEAAYRDGAPWLDSLLAYLVDNRAYVEKRLEMEMPRLRTAKLEGTFLMWLDLRTFGLPSRELCQRLADQYGAVLGSGSSYGPGGEGFLRMNIGCPRATLCQGMDALKHLYEQLELKGR